MKVKENSTFSISDTLGLELVICLWLNFSHLNEHKSRHNFINTVNPSCSCSAGVETKDHHLLGSENFFLVWSNYNYVFVVILIISIILIILIPN